MSITADLVAHYMQEGSMAYGSGDLDRAAHDFAMALALQPDSANARFNLAIVCRDREENESAGQLLQPLANHPVFAADTLNNLGILATRNEQWEVAEQFFRSAIAARHQFPLAHFNLATLLLRDGRFDEGWREHEWRWQTSMFTPLQCPHPQWDGEYLNGTLLLHTEQGAGDTFQFCRYIPMIRERCQRVIFVRPDALDCMFPAESWADEVRSPGEISLDSFQAVLPLISAPLVFGTTTDSIPAEVPYLAPQPREVHLGSCHVPDAKLKVAIAWAGSPTHSNDRFRSTKLEQFAPLWDVAGVAFYSLQKGPQGSEAREFGPHHPVLRHLSTQQKDFADTAAIMRQMDLIISVDTSVLHLAGGLGLPVWGLLSRRCDWRWLDQDREDSPWYPTLRLFRQNGLNDWPELMGRVAAALEVLRNEA